MTQNATRFFALFLVFINTTLSSNAFATPANSPEFQAHESYWRLLANLDNYDAARGAVIASPSKTAPNYFYHWIRDAAVTMDYFASLHATVKDPIEKQMLSDRLLKWVHFELFVQSQSQNLGEPKYHVDGTLFTGDWGRPQTDGPALRALTMIRFANSLLDEGKGQVVNDLLYRSEIPANTAIKRDLEYVSHHWQDQSFDLWEEVKGDHFYTRMAQFSALKKGAELARRLGDLGAANFYEKTAVKIQNSLNAFYGSDKISTTIFQEGAWRNYKYQDLDVAVVLAYLHSAKIKEFNILNDRLLSTMAKLEDSFSFYEINHKGTPYAIGRYPEDRYDGNGMSRGNPWFIGTNAFAEMLCLQAKALQQSNADFKVSSINEPMITRLLHKPMENGMVLSLGSLDYNKLSRAFQETGRKYLSITLEHAGRNGQMDEQFSRSNGFMVGARDLTWSHISYLTAYRACY